MATSGTADYERVGDELAADGAVKSQMFGMPSLKVGGKAFAGDYNGAMVFKLSGIAHAEALQVPGAHLFEPMAGRPMKEWVVLPSAHKGRWAEFARHAMEYVGGRS